MNARRDFSDDIHASDREPSRLQRGVRRVQRSAGDLFGFLVFVVESAAWAVSSFCRTWLTSRPLRALALGLPAAIVAISAAVLAGVVRDRASKEDVVAHYQEAAADAQEQGDVSAANLWLEKAAQKNPSASVHQFHLAMVAADQGDYRKTRDILQRIAPRDREGYAEAHFWLAQDLVNRDLPLTPELAETIDHHLQCSLTSDRTRSAAQGVLGQLSVMREDWDRAIEYFTKAARSRPELYVTLSKLYRQRNQPEQARRAARTASEHFRRIAEDDRENWPAFLQWSLCELQEEDFVTAARILEAIENRVEDPQPVHAALVLAYLGWFDQAIRNEPDDMVKQLELLNRALTYGPEHPRVLTLIANLSSKKMGPDEEELSQPLNDALQRSLAAGVAPAVVHLILGTRQLLDGETDNAVLHLDLAHQANAQVPSVLNNLAWGLAHQDEPDLERALMLVNTAVKLSDRPQIRGTRAVILDLMGQQQQAVTELESVLRRHPDPSWVHERLADLYDRLGDEALSTEHRRLVAVKKASQSPAPPP